MDPAVGFENSEFFAFKIIVSAVFYASKPNTNMCINLWSSKILIMFFGLLFTSGASLTKSLKHVEFSYSPIIK